ncbi:uncharacterized protein [Procambarus clarkii]|uniref:uncharacterized protein isoform X1 n=2 Tax=Procambarus clarkii TaxID=6728 RepID=UPI001E676D4C|nr:uncharacterized protein LOC123744879 isoform X1 [Procambarus clarkii]
MDSDEKTSLDCPVCLEEYDEGQKTPKMMPCLHTVCVSCIIELVTSSATTATSGLTSDHIYVVRSRDERGRSEEEAGQRVEAQHHQAGTQHIYDEPLQQSASGHTSSVASTPSVINGNLMNVRAIAAFANIMQTNRSHPALRRLSTQTASTSIIPRHPRDPLPTTPPDPKTLPSPTSPPALPARKAGLGAPPAPERPQKRASNPPIMPKPYTVAKEPEVPRNREVLCPLCRSLVNTSQLQTNRYVLAHLRDLARLQALHTAQPPRPTTNPTRPPIANHPPLPTPSQKTLPTAPSFIAEDFWCISCDAPCQVGCVGHELSPIKQWVGTLETSLADLQRRAEQHLNAYSTDLDQTDADVKIIFQSLSKATKHLWKSRQLVQEVRGELRGLAQRPTTQDPTQHALALSTKISEVRALDERVGAMEIGVESSEVYIYRQNNKLYLSTCQPDRTIIITVSEGQGQPQI